LITQTESLQFEPFFVAPFSFHFFKTIMMSRIFIVACYVSVELCGALFLRGAGAEAETPLPDRVEDLPDSDFTCPISFGYLSDPVVALDGHIYERQALVRWMTESRGPKFRSPMTNEKFDKKIWPIGLLDDENVPNFRRFRMTRELSAKDWGTELIRRADAYAKADPDAYAKADPEPASGLKARRERGERYSFFGCHIKTFNVAAKTLINALKKKQGGRKGT